MPTVSVRDASNTSVVAVSNTFTVVPAATMTLTGITLSGTTVVAGSGAGTPVGNISVQATGGTFTGTLAVNDTAHFSIGANNTLLAATLASGNYPINITATQSGATGSPLVRAFTIQALASSNTSVNFAAPTGKTLKKTLFGISVSQGTGHALFPNATFRSTANTYLKPSLLRVHPEWELPRFYAEGNLAKVNDLLNNYRLFCQSDVQVVMGCCWLTNFSASTHATQAANFARYLNANGHANIIDWEVGNEWGFTGSGVPIATVVSYFNAVADALHGVNANYRVWGPPQFWADSYNTNFFANQVGTRCAGILWHSYNANTTGDGTLSDSLDVVYGQKGANAPDATTQRNALSGTPLANVPIGPLEFNLGTAPDPFWSANDCGTYVGGVWLAATLFGMFKSTTGLDVSALWEIGADSDFGVIANEQQGSNSALISAQGYFLGKAGQSMFGPEYTTTTTIAKMVVIAVKPSASSFAIGLVNWDQVSSRTINLSISAGGVTTGTISRWEIGKSSPGAPTSPTPVIGTQPSLSTITVASETVVILTGNLA